MRVADRPHRNYTPTCMRRSDRTTTACTGGASRAGEAESRWALASCLAVAASRTGGQEQYGHKQSAFGASAPTSESAVPMGYRRVEGLEGGFTVLELPSREEAVAWAARIAKLPVRARATRLSTRGPEGGTEMALEVQPNSSFKPTPLRGAAEFKRWPDRRSKQWNLRLNLGQST